MPLFSKDLKKPDQIKIVLNFHLNQVTKSRYKFWSVYARNKINRDDYCELLDLTLAFFR